MIIDCEETTEEEIKKMIDEHDFFAKASGFESYEDMENFKVDASLGMIKFGGSFTNALGHALAHADSINASVLIRSFRSLCKEHATLYKKWLAKRNENE